MIEYPDYGLASGDVYTAIQLAGFFAQTGKKKEAWDVYNTKLMAVSYTHLDVYKRQIQRHIAVSLPPTCSISS